MQSGQPIPDQEQNSDDDATADPVTTLLDQYDDELVAWREMDHEARPRYEALRTCVEAAVRAGLRDAGALSPGDVRVWVDPVTLGLRAQRIDIPRPEIDGPFEITFPGDARPTLADVLDEFARRQFARETPVEDESRQTRLAPKACPCSCHSCCVPLDEACDDCPENHRPTTGGEQ